jgi:hypothetical protein
MSTYDDQFIAEAVEIISCPQCDEEMCLVLCDLEETCRECPGCGVLLRIRVTDDEIVIS